MKIAFLIVVSVLSSNVAVAAGLPPGGVVRQGTAIITFDDIDAFAARMPPEQRGGYFNSTKRLDSTLRTLLVERQIADDARKMGLDKDPAVIRQMQIAIDTALMAARMAALRESIKVPDLSELAQERYITDKAKFVEKGGLEVSHILVKIGERSDEDARALAESLRAQVVADPSRFDVLVMEHSEDPSKDTNKGRMRDAGNATTYVPEFAKAATELKNVGDISPLVKTRFGYHVLILRSRTENRQQPFGEVKESLIAELKNEYIQKQMTGYLQGMQNNPLESDAEAVSSLRTRYGYVGPAMLEEAAADKKPDAAPAADGIK